MKTTLSLSFLVLLASCSNSNTASDKTISTRPADTLNPVLKDSIKPVAKPQSKSSVLVLVLPPYDEIANAGISPDVAKYLENALEKDTNLAVVPFPYKRLVHVPYSGVFDKRYCKAIADKVQADCIVMSKLEQCSRTGNMSMDTWSLKIRMYNTHTGEQQDSKISVDCLKPAAINKFIADRHIELATEIQRNR